MRLNGSEKGWWKWSVLRPLVIFLRDVDTRVNDGI